MVVLENNFCSNTAVTILRVVTGLKTMGVSWSEAVHSSVTSASQVSLSDCESWLTRLFRQDRRSGT